MDARNHGTEDRLELYVLGRLPDSDIVELEEHLFLCEPCREKLEEIGAFAPAIRSELPKVRAEEKHGFQWFAWFSTWPSKALSHPGFAVAGAFAAVVLALGIYWIGGNNRVPQMASLTLTAMRSDSKPAVKSSRELDLTITDPPRTTATTAPQTVAPFVVEVVDASGGKVWTGPAARSESSALQVKIARRLSPGEYIVRLNGASGQLLHEYAFQVK